MENNNMSNEEKLARFLEEIRKLGNIRMDGEQPSVEKKSIDKQAEEVFDAVSRIGMSKVREAAKAVKDIHEGAAPKKAPAKDDIIGLLFKEYGSAGRTSEFDEVYSALSQDSSDEEKRMIYSKLKKLSEAEAKAAFLAGFEAAKELFK